MAVTEFLTPYYVANTILALMYPFLRYRGMNHYKLKEADSWLGHTRETSIAGTFILFSLIRYKKYCTMHHAVASVLFYLKVANCCLLFFVDFRLSLVYFVFCSRRMLVTQFRSSYSGFLSREDFTSSPR